MRKQPDFAGYGKGQKGILSLLCDKTATAIKHAQRAEKDAKQTGEDNPSTRVHHLVMSSNSRILQPNMAVKNNAYDTMSPTRTVGH